MTTRTSDCGTDSLVLCKRNLACVSRMLLLPPGAIFATIGAARVLNDFLMIPMADVIDTAFHLRPAITGALSAMTSDIWCHLCLFSLASIGAAHPTMMTDEVPLSKRRVQFDRRLAPSSAHATCSQGVCRAR